MTKSRACANSPALSRRNLMSGMAASGLTFAFASEVKADHYTETDPILPFYRKWWASHVEWNRLADLPGNEEWDWPESIEARDQEHAAMQKMLEITPTSLAGIAALAHLMWVDEGPSLRTDNPEYAEECAQRENIMILQIWRAASGQGGLPPHYSDPNQKTA